MAQYITDFSEYATGSQPSDWSSALNGSTWNVVSGSEFTGGKALQNPNDFVFGSTALTWDKVGTPNAVEIVARGRSDDTDDPTLGVTVYLGRTGYVAEVRNGELILGTREKEFKSVTISTSSGFHWVRLRYESGTLFAKGWIDGEGEPEEWTIEVADRSVSSGGVGAITPGINSTDYDIIGVGTNGDPAPKSSSNPPAAPTNLTVSDNQQVTQS